MILWGKISHFSVFMVLQLLASDRKSGLLELEDNEERSTIFLTEGLVDAVSVPRSDHMLGSKLVKAGHISQSDLRKTILAATLKDSKREFLGLTLMKSGLVAPEMLARTISEQAYDNTLELSNWVEGTFKFIVPRQPAIFTASPRINVQHLLLETSRRLDEGQRPSRKKATPAGDDLCATCSANCSDEQKDKYLKDGICLWRNMSVVVRESFFSPERPRLDEDGERIIDIPFL